MFVAYCKLGMTKKSRVMEVKVVTMSIFCGLEKVPGRIALVRGYEEFLGQVLHLEPCAK